MVRAAGLPEHTSAPSLRLAVMGRETWGRVTLPLPNLCLFQMRRQTGEAQAPEPPTPGEVPARRSVSPFCFLARELWASEGPEARTL